MASPLEPVAAARVGDRQREEADGDGDEDQVEHAPTSAIGVPMTPPGAGTKDRYIFRQPCRLHGHDRDVLHSASRDPNGMARSNSTPGHLVQGGLPDIMVDYVR